MSHLAVQSRIRTAEEALEGRSCSDFTWLKTSVGLGGMF